MVEVGLQLHPDKTWFIYCKELREFDLHYWAPLSDWSAAAGTDAEPAKA